MNKNMIKMSCLLMFFVLVLSSYSQGVSANTPTIGIPTFQTKQATYTADSNNNQLFVQSAPYLNYIPNYAYFNGSASGTVFDLNSITGAPSSPYTNFELFQIPNSGILQFVNGSDNTIQLKYKAQFFNLFDATPQSLTGKSNPTSYDGIALQNGMVYAFKIDVSQLSPIVLSILTSEISGGDTYGITLRLISPMGNVYTQPLTLTKNVAEQIPLLPTELGTYVVTISPDADVILGSMNLDTNPTITSITNGISENIKGTQSVTKIFKLTAPSSIFNYVELHSTTSLTYYLNALPYFGQIYITYFAPNSQSPFPVPFTGTTITNKELYIVVVAQPPDDANPDVKAAKSNAGLGAGFNFEYSFWAVYHTLTDLTIGQDITTLPTDSYSNTFIYYNLKVQKDLAIGINGTGATARIYSLDPTNPIYLASNNHYITITPGSSNLLLSSTNNLVILPKGDYYVRTDTYLKERFTTANIISIPSGSSNNSSINVTSTITSPYIIYLPAVSLDYDYLNITYVDHLNQSINYEFSWYFADGSYDSGNTHNLHYYYNTLLNLQSVNTTSETAPHVGTASNYAGINTEGLYMRINVYGNTQYNSTGYVTTSNNQTIQSTINIRRQNYLDVQAQLNPTFAFYQGELKVGNNNNVTGMLYTYNSTIRGYYHFTSAENTVYKLTIDTTNRTYITAYLRVDESTTWFNLAQTSGVVIANITHYIMTVYFATTDVRNIALYLRFGLPGPDNGTLNINLQTQELLKLPDLGLSSVVSFGVKSQSFLLSLLTNPLTYIIAGGAVVLIALIALLAKRGVFTSVIKKIRP